MPVRLRSLADLGEGGGDRVGSKLFLFCLTKITTNIMNKFVRIFRCLCDEL